MEDIPVDVIEAVLRTSSGTVLTMSASCLYFCLYISKSRIEEWSNFLYKHGGGVKRVICTSAQLDVLTKLWRDFCQRHSVKVSGDNEGSLWVCGLQRVHGHASLRWNVHHCDHRQPIMCRIELLLRR